ncbi:LysR family transcriptional regulator [Acerihabitans arboris]|uniref:LysR family transcriptional regulator n=1 Tax=Acerihabitans arboris TaxID=2691583 RepID=A0A845SP15_9GAMM|nr:LysR family transcriptional regulator [Acerihabitans arboris]NDL65122.1 LysR family transcriptional regulator [Acerihabitans arboris]
MAQRNPLQQVSDFDLRLLRLYITVVECGGFTAAEGVLGITRSAISQHMNDLEKRLGMRLCQRGRAGFALTAEGREVLQAAQKALAAIEIFRADVNQLHQQLRGDLNIGIINNLVTLPRMRITRALKLLRDHSAGVRINLGMTTPAEIERGVLDGRLHAGAIPAIASLSGLDYLPLYQENSFLYCSREHRLFSLPDMDISDNLLAGEDAIVPTYRLPAAAITLYQRLHGAASASDREGIAFLILSGSFIGYLPDHYARQWEAKGMLRPLCPERLQFATPLALITRAARGNNLILDRFLEALGKEEAGI